VFGAQGAVAMIANRELVAVGAGGVDLPEQRPAPAAKEPSRLPKRLGIAAVVLTAIGLLAHAGTLLTRALAAGRVPWGNMYEFLLALTLVGMVAWVVLLRVRPGLRPLGLLVTLVVALLLGAAGMVYTKAGPLVPALNSYWLRIHVSLAATAAGIFLVGFVTGVLYLLRNGYENGRTGFPFALAAKVPSAASLERMTFRIHTFAFPVWTVAIMLGAIWAEAAWGRYWGWDPKETWSFITWVVYAGYLHARATPSVKRPVATAIAVLGYGVLLFNVFGVNLVFSGLHSYSGVN
jgi:cytochrome c-type biogenesis protein CcsB